MLDAAAFERWIGQGVAAWAILMEIEADAWACWLDKPSADPASCWVFAQAIEAEQHYAGSIVSFADEDAPAYPNTPDLDVLAIQLGVKRVVVALALTRAGQVIGRRDYDNIDMATVLWAQDTLKELGRRLDVHFPSVPTSCN